MTAKKTTIAHGDETQIGQDRQITLEGALATDDIRAELSGIETVDTPNFAQHADNLLFMEESVDVLVFPSADKNAEQVVDTYCNGIPQRFIRGQWLTVKRKFVEVLARAKPFNVSTPEIIDGNGNRATSIQTFTGLRYPFEMKDNNPRGAAWLRGILAEG